MDPVYALGEPIACCVHAANRFGVFPGARVALVGCGFMGLVYLQLARHLGAEFICAIEPIAWRREAVVKMDADIALGPEEWRASHAQRGRYDGEFDVVIEAAGAQSAVDLCTDLVRFHGRIILVGYHQSDGGLRTLNMEIWNYKAIDVINGHVRRSDEKLAAMRTGIDMVTAGHLVTKPLVTCYVLEETETAFQELVAVKQGVFKGVLVFTPSDSITSSAL